MPTSLSRLYYFLNQHSLLISLVWLILLFALFYPTKFINIDEHDYLQNAGLLWSGELRQVCDGSGSQYPVNDYCISKYNLGTSVFLLPAALTEVPVGFAITFLVFAAGIIVFHNFLRLLRIDTIYTFLYALFPAFVYYSRTLMSETYSATLILITAYCLWQLQAAPNLRWGILAGMASSFGVLVRYTNLLPLTLIYLVILLPGLYRKSFREIITSVCGILIGGIPWALIILSLNSYLYGAPLRSGYYWSAEEGLYVLSQVPVFVGIFAVCLSLIYPGMLELPLLSRTRLSLLLLPVWATILFYAGFPNTAFEGRPLDLIVGLRFLVPIIPLLLVMYASSLHKWEDRTWFKGIIICLILGLLVVSALLSFQHQQFLLSRV